MKITLHIYDYQTKTAKFWDGSNIITKEYPLGAVGVEWPPGGNASYDEVPEAVEPEPEPEKAEPEKKRTEAKK
jgi:hypothetical protein